MPYTRNLKIYLVVEMNGTVRTVKRRPQPSPSEIVVEVTLRLPTPPPVAAKLDIEIPEPPEANVEAVVGEWQPVEGEVE